MSLVFGRARNLILYTNPSVPIHFEFQRGSINLLVGKNGSGKTTLMRALLREPVVVSGELEFFAPSDLAYLPQEPVFPEHLKVRDLLKLAFLAFNRLPAGTEDRIQKELIEFGIERLADRPLHALSSGERQRAFLARVLLQPCKALLLDEPTNHLDPDVTDRLWERLKQLPQTGVEVIASTHDRHIVRTSEFYKLDLSI